MTTILIDPIETTSKGGHEAQITGINVDDSDILAGVIETPNGTMKVSWDRNGICRDNHHDANIDTACEEIQEALRVAERLSARD